MGPASVGPSSILWQSPAPEANHFIVDRTTPLAATAGRITRPVPTSNGRLVQRQSLGNIHFELPVDAGCGYANRTHLVVCLDLDFRMAPNEALRVLAMSVDPVRVRAGSPQALTVIRNLLRDKPASQAELLVDESCAGDCERRITLETQ